MKLPVVGSVTFAFFRGLVVRGSIGPPFGTPPTDTVRMRGLLLGTSGAGVADLALSSTRIFAGADGLRLAAREAAEISFLGRPLLFGAGTIGSSWLYATVSATEAMEAERALASGYATVRAEDDLSLAGNGPAPLLARPLAFAFGLAASSVDAFRTAPAPPAGGGGGPLLEGISASICVGPGLAERLLFRLPARAGISVSLTGKEGGF